MKFIKLAVSFVFVFSTVVIFHNPQTSNAIVGWAGAAGSPYIGSATTQPMDINVSNNSGNSQVPVIKKDSKGYPNIVWQDMSTGNREIFYAK